jgi:DNA-cytosine methyltransferase
MNVLSLFDGMSCGQISLNNLGIKYTNYFASEVDKYSIKVTQSNFPDTIQIGDVTKVSFKDGILFTENGNFNIGRIDLIMGGSPCQGFSFAGKMLNFDDPRSKLFFEYVRLLKEINPKYFLLENVKMKKESENTITEFLGVSPVEINSSLVSAQNRRRLYWTNLKIDEIVDKGIVFKDIMEKEATNVYRVTEKMMNWINKSPDRIKKLKIYNKDSDCKMQMLEASHHKGISNQRCFMIEDVTNTSDLKYRYISPLECERLQNVPDNYTSCVSNSQRYKMLGNGWTVGIIEHILKGIK